MDALTFLGTGGGVPSGDRAHASILLEEGSGRWLLDAGEPCSQTLKALGVPFGSLEAVFISHGHSDHIGGLPMLIQGAWLEGRRRRLPIYLPSELITPLRNWLEAVYLPQKSLGFAIEYHGWETSAARGLAVELGGGRLRVTIHSTSHLEGLRALIDPAATERFRAYSMAFDWQDGKRLVYSADLGRPEDLGAWLERPCDLLVCELAHFTPEELFDFLRDKPVRRLVLTHLSAELGARGEVEKVRALGTRMLPGVSEVLVVSDGARVEF